MLLEWHHWAIFGVALVLGELLAPGFVILWFGLGALIVSIFLFLLPELSFIAQLLLWAATSVGMVVTWFKVFEPRRKMAKSGRASAEAVGEVGLLINDIEPFGKAKVRFQTPLIGSDVWECVSDEKLPAGTRVKVVSVEGSLLKITKA
jgi:membrane protein implicated in regulation of membrane protease activity